MQKWFRTSFRSSENTLRVLKQMGESGAHSESNQTSKIKLFVKIANIFHTLLSQKALSEMCDWVLNAHLEVLLVFMQYLFQAIVPNFFTLKTSTISGAFA